MNQLCSPFLTRMLQPPWQQMDHVTINFKRCFDYVSFCFCLGGEKGHARISRACCTTKSKWHNRNGSEIETWLSMINIFSILIAMQVTLKKSKSVTDLGGGWLFHCKFLKIYVLPTSHHKVWLCFQNFKLICYTK